MRQAAFDRQRPMLKLKLPAGESPVACLLQEVLPITLCQCSS